MAEQWTSDLGVLDELCEELCEVFEARQDDDELKEICIELLAKENLPRYVCRAASGTGRLYDFASLLRSCCEMFDCIADHRLPRRPKTAELNYCLAALASDDKSSASVSCPRCS